MHAIDALTQRVSSPRLQEPGPSQEQLAILFKAAARAADHGVMKPYRFLLLEREALLSLGKIFREASLKNDPSLSEQQLERAESLPLRAPTIIVAIASCRTNPKVPDIEQQLTAAAATQNMINAAYALGIGAYWRSGKLAYDEHVRDALGLSQREHIVGFVYLGQAIGNKRPLREVDHHVEWCSWP